MATRKTKGRGAPGKAKSKAHREALSKALKAFHAKKGKGKRKSSTKRKTSATTSARRTRTVGKRKTHNEMRRHGNHVKRLNKQIKRVFSLRR